jgi:hemolysin activation/secretion protein
MVIKRRLLLSVTGFVTAMGFCSSSLAQSVDIPSLLEQPRKSMEQKPAIPQDVKIETPVRQVTEPLAEIPEGAEDIKFTLSEIELIGVTVYRKSEIEALYSARLGQNIALSEIFKIAESIKAKYRADGYVLAQVIVPEQDIKGGKVKLNIVEGRIKNVTLNGESNSRKLVQRTIDRVKVHSVFNIKDLEEVMLLANEIPGVVATSTLMPVEGDDIGAVNLLVELDDKKKVSHLITFDNNGSRYLGPYQFGYYLRLDNLLPNQETIFSISTATESEELIYGGINHSAVLNEYGTKASIDLSHSRVSPGYKIEDQDIESSGYYGTFSVSQPIIRSRKDNLTLSSSFSWKDIESTALDLPLYEDRIRSINIGADYRGSDKWYGVNEAGFTITQGLDVFGARETGDPALSRSEGVSDFTKFNASASRQQSIFDDAAVYVAARGQYSSDPLLSAEEFAYGGSVMGRGYDASELAGDSGLAATVELRYFGSPPLDSFQYQPFVFYDAGKIWNEDAVTATKDAAATSAGFGMRFNVGQTLMGDVTLAVPLKRPANAPQSGNGKAPKALFSIYCPI